MERRRFGTSGVSQTGVSLAVDPIDSRKVVVTIDPSLVGDVVLSAHYTTANEGVAFAKAIKVASNPPPSTSLNSIEVDPETGSFPAGSSFLLHVWANYSDGSRLLVFPDPAKLNFSLLSSATGEFTSSGMVTLKAGGAAIFQASYGGQTAQAQFTVSSAQTFDSTDSAGGSFNGL